MLRASMWPGRRLLNLDVGMSPQLIDRGAQHLGTFVPAPKTGGHSSVTTVSSQRCRLKKCPLLYRYGLKCPEETHFSQKPVGSHHPSTPSGRSDRPSPQKARSPGELPAMGNRKEQFGAQSVGFQWSSEPGAHTESWEPELEGIP